MVIRDSESRLHIHRPLQNQQLEQLDHRDVLLRRIGARNDGVQSRYEAAEEVDVAILPSEDDKLMSSEQREDVGEIRFVQIDEAGDAASARTERGAKGRAYESRTSRFSDLNKEPNEAAFSDDVAFPPFPSSSFSIEESTRSRIERMSAFNPWNDSPVTKST